MGTLCALGVLGVLSLLSSCGTKRDAADGAPAQGPGKVRVATVEERPFADEVEALGTVRAFEAIDISANVTETLTQVHFTDGQTVEKDALIAQLSNDEETASESESGRTGTGGEPPAGTRR